jgi:hypothetical protein
MQQTGLSTCSGRDLAFLSRQPNKGQQALRQRTEHLRNASITLIAKHGAEMKRKTLEDELNAWERRALRGDFSQMPQPFRWEESVRFAHFINGYEEAGGFDELAHLSLKMSDAARKTGRWRGSAKDLWLCLFFEHRAARHTGSEPEGERLERLDALCEALRLGLDALEPKEAQSLSSRFKPS